MIYAIHAIGTEYIKFGKAASVGKRLRDLSICNPLELEIVAIADWPDEAERSIHKALEQHNHRGEWFKDSEDTKTVIELMTKKGRGLAKLRLMAGESRQAYSSSQGDSLARAHESQDRPILPAWQQAAINAWAAVMRENCGLAPKPENP